MSKDWPETLEKLLSAAWCAQTGDLEDRASPGTEQITQIKKRNDSLSLSKKGKGRNDGNSGTVVMEVAG